jgi:hypothetical protein
MDFDRLFASKYLKAGEFQKRDVTLTISGVRLEELDGAKGKEMKAIVSFRETPKQLVLNKTNGLSLKAMFGRETDQWTGKRVTLYPAEIKFEDSDLAIRVRGSPDLTDTVTFELKLARKKPRTVMLTKTGAPKTVAKTLVVEPVQEEPPLPEFAEAEHE